MQWVVALGLLVLVVPAVAWAGDLVCPKETLLPDDWRALLTAPPGDAAARQLQRLLDDHDVDLMAAAGDGGLISVRQAVLTLPAPARTALAGPYEAAFGDAARAELDRVTARPDHAVADLCAVATRYPLARAADDARRQAAERARSQGDLAAAAVLAARGRPPAVEPLPFDAPWYARLQNIGAPRSVPVGSAEWSVVVDRERGVLAFGPGGRPRWRYAPPPLVAVAAAVRPGDTGRGPASVPAVLADDAGRPQLVVVRLGVGLTTLRASDGRLFWSTDGDPAWAGVAFVGPPAVAGRCVAAVAIVHDDPDQPDSAALSLVTADVTDGRPLWRCPIGPVYDAPLRPGAAPRRAADPYRDGVPPTFAGDLILAPDNAGGVVAVDRFGGDVRWARPYDPTPIPGQRARVVRAGPQVGWTVLPPVPDAAVLRWSGAAVVAGDVVWVAPQDSTVAMALDRRTGRQLWQNPSVAGDVTCVGVARGRFILGGQSITAVDPATGDAVWIASPPEHAELTGPPVVRGDRVFVRSTLGLLEVSAADGTVGPAPVGTPDFAAVAASPAGHAALLAAGIAASFDRR